MDDISCLRIGFAITGSHCCFDDIIPVIEEMSRRGADILPIASEAAHGTDTRFGPAASWMVRIQSLTDKRILHTISDVEPIGPQKLIDVLVIAPCTGNTLAKLARGITDSTVTMAAKAHMRNRRPVVLAISTNDALGFNGENLGRLLAADGVFFVPFAQDDPQSKPTSCIADWGLILDSVVAAAQGRQLQPVLLGPPE